MVQLSSISTRDTFSLIGIPMCRECVITRLFVFLMVDTLILIALTSYFVNLLIIQSTSMMIAPNISKKRIVLYEYCRYSIITTVAIE